MKTGVPTFFALLLVFVMFMLGVIEQLTLGFQHHDTFRYCLVFLSICAFAWIMILAVMGVKDFQ